MRDDHRLSLVEFLFQKLKTFVMKLIKMEGGKWMAIMMDYLKIRHALLNGPLISRTDFRPQCRKDKLYISMLNCKIIYQKNIFVYIN